MYLIEILLPLYDNQGERFADQMYRDVRNQLAERFGGITAFTRAPAEGETESDKGKVRDDIMIFEVMSDQLDREWWAAYRKKLEHAFEQDEIVVRATACERL